MFHEVFDIVSKVNIKSRSIFPETSILRSYGVLDTTVKTSSCSCQNQCSFFIAFYLLSIRYRLLQLTKRK